MNGKLELILPENTSGVSWLTINSMLTDRQKKNMGLLYDRGVEIREIARRYNISLTAAFRALKDIGK